MTTRFDVVLGIMLVGLSASADIVHETFNANRDAILASPISVLGESAYLVGIADSPRNLGSAVGYGKAEALAKWNIFERYRSTVSWPDGTSDEEKELAWLEYRSRKSDRIAVHGLQRIYSRKLGAERYLVVLALPADSLADNPPRTEDIVRALEAVRERRRLEAEAALKIAPPEIEDSSVDCQDIYNESLML